MARPIARHLSISGAYTGLTFDTEGSDEATLKEVADLTGGKYSSAESAGELQIVQAGRSADGDVAGPR